MSYEKTLNAEINAELNRLTGDGKQLVANWIAHTICKDHEEALDRQSEDSMFWRHCGYATTRDAVRRQINARAGDRDEADKRQAKLPGFQHLQYYYIVKRPKVGEVGVPIDSMTDSEIDEKIVRYEGMSVACKDHADELRGYKATRRRRRPRGVNDAA